MLADDRGSQQALHPNRLSGVTPVDHVRLVRPIGCRLICQSHRPGIWVPELVDRHVLDRAWGKLRNFPKVDDLACHGDVTWVA